MTATLPLDDIDHRILRELQFNARITNAELSAKVGLSPTPCWNRVRRMERAKIIQHYVTIFDESALGVPDTVIIELRLERHDEETLTTFGRALADLPEVTEAYLVTGEYDYLVKVVVAGTMGYERFLRERLYQIPGIHHSRSSFALRCLKRSFSFRP